jgi:uncharacterized RDD family membrane protein YckC
MMQDSNPYAPPTSQLDEPRHAPSEEQLASTGQRFSNLILDQLGYGVLSFVAGIGFAMVDPQLTEGSLSNLALGVGLLFLYYVPFETLLGLTPAKLVTGTRVVAEDGGPASFAQVLGRTLVRTVPFEPFSFLGGDGHPVGWHDSWSRTRVIRTRNP